jgi:Fe-Mn family superoxide dismutase
VKEGTVAFQLPPLPWADDALEPTTSARTISFHYGKHHQAYVDNLNKLVAGTDLEGTSLEEVIAAVAGDPAKAGVFNNAAQVWNHTFFWSSMKPGGGGAPSGALAAKIDAAFGGLAAFVDQFKTAAVGRFGSGWVWLVDNAGALKIVTTPNAEMPVPPVKPLFTCDVWEHAYYLDFQNRRPDFVQAFLDSLVDWDFAAKNLGA